MTALFWVLAPLAAASGFMVFRFNSMARVTISLLVSFLATGALLILLGLGYLGVVVILMMVIEMIIMAVFMIAYMENPAGLIPMSMYHNKPGSLAVSIGTFALLGAGIFAAPWPRRARARRRGDQREHQRKLVGQALGHEPVPGDQAQRRIGAPAGHPQPGPGEHLQRVEPHHSHAHPAGAPTPR